MNLKIPFVRKFILVLVAKITSFEADRAKGKTIVKNGTIVTKKQKTRLKNWLNS